MKKTLAIATLALFATSAFAQTAAVVNWVEIDDDNSAISVLGMTVDQIEDLRVYDASGTQVGEVEQVLGTAASTATALAIDLDNDTQDDDVVIALDQVTVADGRINTTLTRAELEALPRWND